jgi:hypothetical protein
MAETSIVRKILGPQPGQTEDEEKRHWRKAFGGDNALVAYVSPKRSLGRLADHRYAEKSAVEPHGLPIRREGTWNRSNASKIPMYSRPLLDF